MKVYKDHKTYQIRPLDEFRKQIACTMYFTAPSDEAAIKKANSVFPKNAAEISISRISPFSMLQPRPTRRRRIIRHSEEQLKRIARNIVDILDATEDQQFDILKYVFIEMSRRSDWTVDASEILSWEQDGLDILQEEEMSCVF